MRTASILAAALGLVGVNAQCLNNVAQFNPNLRTQTANSTWLVLPVPSEAVQKAIDENYAFAQANPANKISLLDVPAEWNFPSGHHPIVVSISYQADIRMSALQIDGPLQAGAIQAPFVGKGSSKTPLQASLPNYIGGTDEALLKQLAGLVPGAVSTLVEGSYLRLGLIEPNNKAYQSDAPGLYSAQAKWIIVPNPLTGPGVYVESHDLAFVNAKHPKYTLSQLKEVINQPVLLNGPILTGQCIRNTYYLDSNSTGIPILQTGNVTIGPASSGLQKASPDGFGTYSFVDGVSSCAQVVGYNPEDCDTSAANVDPGAL